MTPERAKELIDSLSDDALIDMATTATRKDVRLAAELHLRKRYPSRKKLAHSGGTVKEK